MLVPIPYTHGGFVHTRCMLDRADRIARGHANPRACVACQSAWPGGIRSRHPAELARGLPMTELGGRWAAVGRALQFAALLQRDALGTEPASYVTTRVRNMFDLRATALRRSSTSSSVLCSLFNDTMDLPQEACLDFPVRGNGERLQPTTVRCSSRTASDQRISCSGSQIGGYTLNLTFKSIWRAVTPNWEND